MDKITPLIKNFAESSDIYIEVEKIGQEFGLHLDQLDELDMAIRSVLLGKIPANSFTETISTKLEVNRDVAEKISQKVSSGIMQTLREKMQSSTENETQSETMSSMERVGQFSFEKSIPSENEGSISEKDKPRIIQGIENPVTGANYGNSDHTEPLSDHLLKSSFEQEDLEKKSVTDEPEQKEPEIPPNLPVSEPEEAKNEPEIAVEIPKPAAPTAEPEQSAVKPPEPPKPKSTDMYREPID